MIESISVERTDQDVTTAEAVADELIGLAKVIEAAHRPEGMAVPAQVLEAAVAGVALQVLLNVLAQTYAKHSVLLGYAQALAWIIEEHTSDERLEICGDLMARALVIAGPSLSDLEHEGTA